MGTVIMHNVVSVDGFKASLLERAYHQYSRRGKADFVVIGHPKALTRYSLQMLESFAQNHRSDRFVGFNAYRAELGSPQH